MRRQCRICVQGALALGALIGSCAGGNAQSSLGVRTQSVPNRSDPVSASSGQTSAPETELNERVVRFCREKVGKQVGNGQCAMLIVEALRAAGAETRFKDSPGSGDYVWGAFVCKLEVKNGVQSLEVGEAGRARDKHRRTDVRAGDILQFRDAEFQGTEIRPEGRYTYRASRPHHTAVISHVSEDGASCKVLEQNYNGKLTVVESTIRLPDLTHGWLRVYRPLPKTAR